MILIVSMENAISRSRLHNPVRCTCALLFYLFPCANNATPKNIARPRAIIKLLKTRKTCIKLLRNHSSAIIPILRFKTTNALITR